MKQRIVIEGDQHAYRMHIENGQPSCDGQTRWAVTPGSWPSTLLRRVGPHIPLMLHGEGIAPDLHLHLESSYYVTDEVDYAD